MSWLVPLLIFLAVGGGFFAIRGRNQKALPPGDDWRAIFQAAAEPLAARVAAAGSDLQLRAESGGVTITVKQAQGDLIAEAPVLPGATPPRLFLGSAGATAPQDFLHVPERAAPPAFILDPPVSFRSDDAARAEALVEPAGLALDNTAQAAGAKAASVLCRGGTVRLTLVAPRARVESLEAAVAGTARLVNLLGGDRGAAEASLRQLPAAAEKPVVCMLCGGERRPGVAWVSCSRCQAPHHAECWASANACARPGCGGVISAPL